MNGNKVSVLKFDGNSWTNVGNLGFSAGQAIDISLKIGTDDKPIVAYKDFGNSYKASVMKFDGNSWVYVGGQGFSAGQVSYMSMTLDADNNPIVAYQDNFNGNKLTSMKFNGTEWISLGTPGFSSNQVSYMSITLLSDNNPMIVFYDFSNNGKATAMKFDGISWVLMGTAGFSNQQAYQITTSIDLTGVPYVAYTDGQYGSPVVKKFENYGWVDVGNPGALVWSVTVVSLAFNSNNIPYLAYANFNNNYMAGAMTFDGNNWLMVGPTEFSDGEAQGISIVIDKNNNPYVTYYDMNNNGKATVMKFTAEAVVNYSGSFTESYADDGSVTGSRVATLINDTFVNAGDVLMEGVQYSLDNKPDGLNSVMTVSGDGTTATLTFTGNAIESIVDVKNLTINFLSGAFTNNINASTVINHINNNGLIHLFSKIPGDWVKTTNGGISTGGANYISMKLDSNNIPYIAYQDFVNGQKVTVKKFNGTTWELVGNQGFSSGQAEYISLAIDNNNVPYVVYKDYAVPVPGRGNVIKATAMKFDGVNWVLVGTQGFSSFGSRAFSMDIGSDNVPYVAYQEGDTHKATVKKFDGNDWVLVGPAGFSGSNIMDDLSIAIDSNNHPWVAYSDQAVGHAVTVKKFDGNDWVLVGQAGFSGQVSGISLAFDSTDTPYVSYADSGAGQKATVMKFNGIDWVYVGSRGFSSGMIGSLPLKINSNDVPYVGYSDSSFEGKANVSKFDGNAWLIVGTQGFSEVPAAVASIDMGSNNIPYIAYRDAISSEADVMKFYITPPTSIENPPIVTPGNKRVMMSWNPPASDGGSPIIDYIVEYKLSGSPDDFSKKTSDTPEATVTDLTNRSSYDFRVMAVNEVGIGQPSPVISAIPTDTTIGHGSGGMLTTNVSSAPTSVSSNLDINQAPDNIIITPQQNALPASVSSIIDNGIKSITKNLQSGVTSSEVKILQQFLVNKATGPKAKMLKEHGLTKNFGPLTKEALIEWQMDIYPYGYFGPKTRAIIKSME